MTNMKNFFDKKYSKYLLLLLAFAFILSSVSGIIFMTNKYNIISVDNKKIGINEFLRMLNSKRQIDYYSAKNKEAVAFLNSREYMTNFLNNLLYETILYKSIYDLELLPNNDFILSEIIKEEVFKTNGNFDLNKFNTLISTYNLTQQNYIDLMKDQESQTFLFSLFGNKLNNDNIVDIFFNYNNLYKDVTVYKINKNNLKIKDGVFTDNDLKEYYESNIDDFKEEETRKIDYIVLNKDIDKNKVEELLLTSFDIKELASKLNVSIKTLGYLNSANILKNENINDLINYNVNDFSKLKIDGDNYLVYSVVDIKEGKLKTFEESKKIITNILNKIYIDNNAKEVVSNYIKENKNRQFFVNKGFTSKNYKITRTLSDFNEDFVKNVLSSDKYSNVFIDGDFVYFAKINSSGFITDKDSNFVSKEDIKNNINILFGDDVRNAYFNYLNNYKYKVKVNYKLLDLIKNG